MLTGHYIPQYRGKVTWTTVQLYEDPYRTLQSKTAPLQCCLTSLGSLLNLPLHSIITKFNTHISEFIEKTTITINGCQNVLERSADEDSLTEVSHGKKSV